MAVGPEFQVTGDKLQVESQASPSPADSVRDELFCPECGYSLRHLVSLKCPECGLSLAFIDGPDSTIPWGNRRKIGRVRAFVRTVMLICFWPKRVPYELARAACVDDATAFRRATVGWVILVAVVCAALYFRDHIVDLHSLRSYFGEWFLPTVLVSGGLAFYFMMATTAELFLSKRIPSEIARRAAALSNYSSAWLFWLWLPAAALTWGTQNLGNVHYIDPISIVLAAGAVVGIAICWWLNLVRLATCLLRQPLLTLRVATLAPLLWIAVWLVIGAGIPAIGLFIEIVCASVASG